MQTMWHKRYGSKIRLVDYAQGQDTPPDILTSVANQSDAVALCSSHTRQLLQMFLGRDQLSPEMKKFFQTPGKHTWIGLDMLTNSGLYTESTS